MVAAKLTVENKVTILDLARQGWSTPRMAKLFGVSSAACYLVMRRAGVSASYTHHKRKPPKLDDARQSQMVERAREGATNRELAAEFGVSMVYVTDCFKRLGVTGSFNRHRTHALNESFFDSIDTEGKAWLLGFIAADGYVNSNHSVILGLQHGDREILFKIRDMLGSTAPVMELDKERNGTPTPTSRLIVTSKHMAAKLAAHTIIPNKSWTLRPWDGPSNLMRHYWRGCVDGDGHLGTRKFDKAGLGRSWATSFVGNQEMTDAYARFIAQGTGVMPNTRTARPTKCGNHLFCSVVFTGLRKTQAVARLLYTDSTIHLARKKALADLVQSTPMRGPGGKAL